MSTKNKNHLLDEIGFWGSQGKTPKDSQEQRARKTAFAFNAAKNKRRNELIERIENLRSNTNTVTFTYEEFFQTYKRKIKKI